MKDGVVKTQDNETFFEIRYGCEDSTGCLYNS